MTATGPDRGTTPTRERLLAAANAIVLRDGAARLTLDAVAREAGLSKGGVLYHFRTKEALISGLVAHALDRYEAEVERVRGERGDDGPGGWLRAYVAVSAAPGGEVRDLDAGLLAVFAADPGLLEGLLDPVRVRYARWQARAEADGLDSAVATLVRLAADALSLADLLDFAPPAGATRERLLALAEGLTRDGAA